MQLFDLHCDSIVPYKTLGDDFLCEKTQFSLRELSKFQKLCQTMAVFIPDTIRGEEAFLYAKAHFKYLNDLAGKQNDIVEIVHNTNDIRRITGAGKCALLLAIESGAALAGNVANVECFFDLGVKIMTLVWNGENEIASGHSTDKGFTSFGRQVVEKMEQVGMLVDVSHLNDRGFEELCTFAREPFIATHSNLRTVCGHKRNLTKQQFQEIVKRKGLVGVNLYERFLSDTAKGDVDSLYRHIEEMLSLEGEDVIACGSDFDGADIEESLNTPAKFAQASEYLLKKGIKEAVVKKIFFENAVRFFETRASVKFYSE